MSLRSTIILVLSAVAVLWAIADSVLLQTMVTSHFERIAHRSAEDELQRAEEHLESEVQSLRMQAEGLAISPVLRGAINTGDEERLEEFLNGDSLSRAGLNVAIVVGEDETVLHYYAQDQAGEDVRFKAFPSGSIARSNPLLKASEEERISSILNTQHGFLVACAYPVVLAGPVPDNLGSIKPLPMDGQAVLIVGRLIEDEVHKEADGHETIIRLTDIYSGDLSEDQARGLQLLENEGEVRVVDRSNNGGLTSFRCMNDAAGKPTLLLQVDLSPDALLEGRKMQQFLALSTVGTSAVIFLVLLRVLQRAVIAPLTSLTKQATEIGRTDNTTVRLKFDRKDEIGQLSQEFDRMLDKLEVSRRQVIDSARQAGMSEIATGVLHNVGNVLNSVNVSRGLIERKLDAYVLPDLERIVGVLRDHGEDLPNFFETDPRGPKLLPFLEELTQSLISQHAEVVLESENLRESVNHIADLVRSQQAYAGSRGVFERVSLAVELDNALKISVQAFGRDLDLQVVRNCDPELMVSADRHKLMEILINLIQNAKQAMDSADVQQRVLRVEVRECTDGRVKLSVSDNGVGIPEEHLTRIFGHGFTTKPGGHGFGLHGSANAAKEMKADLEVASDGVGQGATFTLTFQPAEEVVLTGGGNRTPHTTERPGQAA